MRKLFFVIVILISITAEGQNFHISFNGTGASTIIDQVKVENLSTGASLTLNGSDLLHLSGTDGISQQEISSSPSMKIYPNPMVDNTILGILAPVKGDAVITIYEITGKVKIQIRCYLENYREEFNLSGLKNGLYLVNVTGNTYQFSGKLFSECMKDGDVKLEKINYTGELNTDIMIKKNFTESQASIYMHYSHGERLKFTAISGEYSRIKTDIPTQDNTVTFDFIPCKDGDNYNYPIVTIGTQTWMAENLKTTRFRNGDSIATTDHPTLDILSKPSPKYEWAYGSEANAAIYGRLYTWYLVEDCDCICPLGWHVPTDAEWSTLSDYLGGNFVAGGKLKETGIDHWADDNTAATNESGFTAISSGKLDVGAVFNEIRENGYWWSSTKSDDPNSFYRVLSWYDGEIRRSSYQRNAGFSIRCIYDIGQSIILPSLTTLNITDITSISATTGGNITYDGGGNITERGICWSTSANPTKEMSSKITNGTGSGSFTCNISGLTGNTTYYVRAYASNKAGTAYGNEILFTTSPYVIPPIVFNPGLVYGSLTDINDNTYKTIVIGNQEWMAENLKTTRYANGDLIGTTSPSNLNISSEIDPKYQWEAFGKDYYVPVYGRVYTWYAATDSRNVCPAGWHLPNDDEWLILLNNLDGTNSASTLMKETGATHWVYPNNSATNQSGFTALPGGYRYLDNFEAEGFNAYWWSSSETPSVGGSNFFTYSNDYSVYQDHVAKYSGYSVRCMNDSLISTSLATISTKEIVDVTLSTASSGGEISSDGGASITACGICWSMRFNPTIADNKTSDSIVSGSFISTITGLNPGTTYYVRAYAINKSGISYGNKRMFTTLPDTTVQDTTIIFNPDLTYGSVTDNDGNTYKTIVIGSNEWMAENLKTTKYANGDLLPTTDPASLNILGESNPKYQWACAGKEDYVANYGRLYTWYAATDIRNVCPTGWHLPTDEEWSILINFLGGGSVASNKLKEVGSTHWYNPYKSATNESGFTALPGGGRSPEGYFNGFSYHGSWWISKEYNISTAYYMLFDYDPSYVQRGGTDKSCGSSIRCVKD